MREGQDHSGTKVNGGNRSEPGQLPLSSNPCRKRVAIYIGSAMIMAVASFSLTVLATQDLSGVVELDPTVAVGSFTSFLFSELVIFASGVVAVNVRSRNDGVKVVLSGFIMALMSGDLANDLVRLLVPSQPYFIAVAPVLTPVCIMALVAADVEESHNQPRLLQGASASPTGLGWPQFLYSAYLSKGAAVEARRQAREREHVSLYADVTVSFDASGKLRVPDAVPVEHRPSQGNCE